MALFKPWTWLQSEERKLKIKKLELEVQQEEIKVQLLQKQLTEQPILPIAVVSQEVKPYKNVRVIGDSCYVTLWDGLVVSKAVPDPVALFQQVRDAQTESDVISLFMDDSYEKEMKRQREEAQSDKVIVETEEERDMVWDNINILQNDPDFTVNGKNIYLTGISLPMPASVAGSFIELLEKMDMAEGGDIDEWDDFHDAYEGLKMFWYWTALNPIESSRNDLLSFIRKEDIKITKNGMLEMYRRVVTNTHEDTELVDAISNHYYQIKKWKKSPSNYQLFKCTNSTEDAAEYVLGTSISDAKIQKYNSQKFVGNLQELYNELPNMKENSYTDSHTGKKSIKVGQIYKEDEDKIDLDNTQTCSSGLHVGSKSFGFKGFGDTGVLALVNPSKVRSVPYYESNKMRVSEMYIAAVLELDDYKESVTEATINDFSEEYCKHSVEELQEALEGKTFESGWTVQGHKPAVTVEEAVNIKEILAAKVMTF